MLRWAGFEATGLELSPWLTKLASDWFAVPMLTGRLESQNLPPGSLDAVILMDVLEHLPDPRATMEAAIRLLSPTGFLLVQTPCFPGETPDLATLEASNHPFLHQLKPMEHIYLFSKGSVSKLFASLGLDEIRFEPAVFAHYDMYFAASARKLSARAESEWTDYLSRSSQNPSGRSVLAILDASQERDRVANLNRQLETAAAADAVAANVRDEKTHEITERLGASEADRAARLEVIMRQGARTVELEALHDKTLKEHAARLAKSETDRAAHAKALEEAQERLAAFRKSRVVRFLRACGWHPGDRAPKSSGGN